MSRLLLSICIILTLSAGAQAPLIPGKNSFQPEWIKQSRYSMNWYFVRDTARYLMGTVHTELIPQKEQLLLITRVMMKNMKTPWIDSSIARMEDLSPVYHSSYNSQRNMVLRFGPVVTGYYEDLMRKKNTEIQLEEKLAYFDSNIYPYLLSLLPYQEGYTRNLAIFDYNPAGKTGVIGASVIKVDQAVYQSKLSAERKVWRVEVSDEIGQGPGSSSIYYFDQEDRRLWKQEIIAGGRKMEMVRNEE